MHINIPKNAEKIIQVLESAGYEAYVVGGCVRDSILGRNPDDWDITTSASPEIVKSLFERTIDTGIQHGTVTVLLERETYEVTTFRIDGEYEDHRHPKEIQFTSNLSEDLKRRDFTINAMAYSHRTGLVDCFGGCDDLRNGIIRCVGNADERFGEDALRIMRAVRFSAQLGFDIEESTICGIENLVENLKDVSAERIQTELIKLLVSDHPDYLRKAYEYGITKAVLPEFDVCMKTPQNTPHHKFSVGEHILHSMKVIRSDKVLRLTMLLHDIGKPEVRTTDDTGRDHFKTHAESGMRIASQILKRLKFDNNTTRTVLALVKWHDCRPIPQKSEVRKAIYMIGEDIFPLYLEVQRADTAAQSNYKLQKKLDRMNEVERLYSEIMRDQDCLSLKTLDMNGKDLMKLGCPKGKMIGELLNRLLVHVLEHPEDNTKETLSALAAAMLENNRNTED